MARRQSLWIDILIEFTVLDGSQASLGMVLTPGSESEGFTVVRTILNISYFPSTLAVANGAQGVDIGLGIASKESIASAVLPDPLSADEKPIGDWMHRDRVVVMDDATDPHEPVRRQADIRASRKLAGGEMFLIAQSRVIAAVGFTVELYGICRALVLRP